MTEEQQPLKCSFCSKTQEQVEKRRLVAGPGVYICTACLKLGMQLAEEEEEGEGNAEDEMVILTPKHCVEALNEYVVGQLNAKKHLANACYDHGLRIKQKEGDVVIEKKNLGLLGPSGTGKTELIRALKKIYPQIPIAITDATSLTEAGYVGDDVENILLRLIQEADYDIEKAEKGIIYIDEFDKLARKGDSPSLSRDVSGEGVQQALLKIIEGNIVSVPMQGGRKHPHGEMFQIDTTNILFILGGAFEGIEQIVQKRKNKQTLGFASKPIYTKDTNWYQFIEPEDLKAYGIIPELLGRIPVIATLDPLTKEQLVEIMTEPKNALYKQYQERFKKDGKELRFEKSLFERIAEKAYAQGTGARSLSSITELLMFEIKFQISGEKNIEKVLVRGKYFDSRDLKDVQYDFCVQGESA